MVYLEGCITDNPHERAPRPRDRFGRVHGIIPADAPFASTVRLLYKTCNIYICITFIYCFTLIFAGLISGEELRHSGDNGHNTGLEEARESHPQAQCTCGVPMWYKTHLDSLLRCAGLPECDQIDDISDEPDIYVRYAGDEDIWATVQAAETVSQAFDRGAEMLRQCAAEQTVPTQEQIPTQAFSTQVTQTQVCFFFNIQLVHFKKKILIMHN